MKKRGMMITAISAATAMLVSTAVPVLADAYTIANTPKCIGISWWDRMEVGNKRYAEASGNEVYQSGPTGDADTAVQISSIEDGVYCAADLLIFGCKMMIDKDLLVDDLLHITGADGIILEKNISVKNNTLIDTILRNSAVEDSTVYKNNITRLCGETFFV